MTVLAALTGCSEATDKDATSKPTSSGKARESNVKLLDAGAEPRQPLRFQVQVGDVQRMSMRMVNSTSMRIDGTAVPAAEVPPMVLGMRVEVTDIGSDGVIESTFAYDSADVEGAGATSEQLEEVLEDNLLGVTGELEVTDTGEFVDGDMDIPSGIDPSMRAMLRSIEKQMSGLTVPLPSEEVGIGAVWTAETQTAINDIEVNSIYRFELVEHSGDVVVLKLTTTGTAPEQDPDLPGMPSGATVHLDRMELSGTGRSELDLTRLLPLSGISSSAGDIKMTIEEGGSSSIVLQKLKMRMELSSR